MLFRTRRGRTEIIFLLPISTTSPLNQSLLISKPSPQHIATILSNSNEEGRASLIAPSERHLPPSLFRTKFAVARFPRRPTVTNKYSQSHKIANGRKLKWTTMREEDKHDRRARSQNAGRTPPGDSPVRFPGVARVPPVPRQPYVYNRLRSSSNGILIPPRHSPQTHIPFMITARPRSSLSLSPS